MLNPGEEWKMHDFSNKRERCCRGESCIHSKSNEDWMAPLKWLTILDYKSLPKSVDTYMMSCSKPTLHLR
ncbi:unnamed protein product, partial [Choristocarpus tenellus]